jgi:fermentation-respiration switch protein FrsA (DUF1100 family)
MVAEMSADASPPTSRSSSSPRRLSLWKRRLLWLTVLYVGLVVMLASMQRSLIYHPFREKSLRAQSLPLPAGQALDVSVRTEDNLDLRGWLILAKGITAADAQELEARLREGRPVVLYFPGNAGNRAFRELEFKLLTDAGADVMLFDYRGYGDSPGEPSEEGLARDARAVWRFATETHQIEPRRLVLFGESLGGGVAVRLASDLSLKKTPPAALILRSTFSSLTDAASNHFPWMPVRWVLIDRFPSEQMIQNVTCPILQLHGRRDTVVPFRLGQKLFATAPETSASGLAKRFVELPNANHNDVISTSHGEVLAAVRDLLSKVTPP